MLVATVALVSAGAAIALARSPEPTTPLPQVTTSAQGASLAPSSPTILPTQAQVPPTQVQVHTDDAKVDKPTSSRTTGGPPPAARQHEPTRAAAQVSGDRSPTQGVLQVTLGEQVFEMPLVHTEVNAEISGFVADVEVSQVFSNPFDEPIEAQYLFPLPDNAAVDAMEFTVGDRTIVGEIRKREEARAIYEAARDAGKTASLLDQQRPNVFHQSVANILPGDAVEVTIHFVQTLDYDDGGYEWAYPMVVGPRFIPQQGTGARDPVEDARRLEGPYSSKRTGNDIDVRVSVDAGVPIWDIRSPSHAIDMERPEEQSATLQLKSRDRIPNKDFVLRYEVAGEQPEAALLTHSTDEGGYFLLMIQPQADEHLRPETVTPKEMVFVVDTSCSMSGLPLDKAKDLMSLAIAEMNPQDRFMILDFDDTVSALSPMPLPNSPANRRRGEAFVRSFQGSGGTHMLQGIQASLDLPEDPNLLRTVLFLTDGYIGNETQILSAIEQRLGRSRLFSLGIGSSTNRYLLERMAKVGRGHAQYLRPDEDGDEAVEAFYERIRNPVLTDIEIQWEGVDVVDVYPDPIPDLFAGQPVVLVGRYEKPGTGLVRLSGRVRGEEHVQEIPVVFPSVQEEHSALASLWARTAIEDLETRQYRGNRESIRKEVTQLALRYDLVSPYTSFVAVEERIVNENGSPRTLRIPLEGPEFVDLAATLGHANAGAFPPALRGQGQGAGGYGQGRGYYGKRGGTSTPLFRGGAVRRGGGGSAPRRSGRSAPSWLGQTKGAFETADAELDSITSEPALTAPDIGTETLTQPTPGRDRTRLRTVSSGKAAGLVKIELSHAAIQSGLDGNRLLDDLEDLLSDVTDAWARRVRTSSELRGGDWVLRLELDTQGRVRSVTLVSDSLQQESLRSLVEGEAIHWQLTSLSKGPVSTVEFKVSFQR